MQYLFSPAAEALHGRGTGAGRGALPGYAGLQGGGRPAYSTAERKL